MHWVAKPESPNTREDKRASLYYWPSVNKKTTNATTWYNCFMGLRVTDCLVLDMLYIAPLSSWFLSSTETQGFSFSTH
jgi:hypothetical protein